MERILVTGGAGFIGSHIVCHHLDKGDEVWVIDELSTGRKENLGNALTGSRLRFDHADVATFSRLQAAVNWCDKIYHAAASVGMFNVLSHPLNTLANNIYTTEKLFQAVERANKKIRFLFISSSGVYSHVSPSSDGKFHEDMPLKIPSGGSVQECYSLSKIVGEVMTLSFVDTKGIDGTVARIFNTIGVRQSEQYGMVVPRFIQQALQGEPITVYGNGAQTRSFVNVHDVVNILDLLLETPESKGGIFNVGHDEEITILALAELVKKKTQSSSEIIFLPYKKAYGLDFVDVTKRRPDISKIEALTNFKPQWSLDQTLDEVIEYFQKIENKTKKKVCQKSSLTFFRNVSG